MKSPGYARKNDKMVLMQLYNSLTRKAGQFEPLAHPVVTFYSCGPTVYDYTHIGHMRTYINVDVLKRTLLYLGYQVKHVMNITDVGHLTGDDDSGEDKLEKGAQKTGQSVWDVATFYTDFFLQTIKALNILPADFLVKATDHIKDMIQLIQKLEEKGFTYNTEEAVYFDTSKFPDYGKLSGQQLDQKKHGARAKVKIDPQKKQPADFALWFKRVGRFANHTMHWNSPWGDGFPGWHIECSAMSMKYLGETIDIHSGGVDHIPVHHENEIAQSECATGQQFVRFWFHNAFLLVDGQKMSKSLNNFYTLEDLEKQAIEPLALRLLFLQIHYRQEMNFTWDSAKAAQEAYNKIKDYVNSLRGQTQRTELSQEKAKQIDDFRQQFTQAASNDLQIPQGLAIMWEVLKSNIPSTDKLDLVFDFDKVLGLKLSEVEEETAPEEIIKLADEREEARQNNNFAKADELRSKIEEKGYMIEDIEDGYKIKKRR